MCEKQAWVQQENNEWKAEGDALEFIEENISCLNKKCKYMRSSSCRVGLTLMLELSMFSKSSAEMVGTLLTRSIRKRPTLLSAVTLPDWDRSNSITFIASISVKPITSQMISRDTTDWYKAEQQEQETRKNTSWRYFFCYSVLGVWQTVHKIHGLLLNLVFRLWFSTFSIQQGKQRHVENNMPFILKKM